MTSDLSRTSDSAAPADTGLGVRSPARRRLLIMAAALGGASFAGAIFNPVQADLAASLNKLFDLDTTVLNFAIELEEMEADFFSRVFRAKGYNELDGQERALMAQFANQDNAHHEQLVLSRSLFTGFSNGASVDLNRSSSAAPRMFHYPRLNDRDAILKTALDIKETAVFAYHGAAGLVRNKTLLTRAVAIAGVEGRHVATLREVMGLDPVPAPFEGALTAQVSGRKLGKYGFEGGAPR